MSKVRSDNISNRADDGAPALVYGAEVPVGYGITGAGGISITGIVTATGGSFSGNVSVGGVLTYADVTNIDSVGIITARSDVSIADKIIHTGDTNTAIRFPAADTFTVETGGSERVRITSTGQGIFKGDSGITEAIRIAPAVDASSQQEFGIGLAVNSNHTHPAAKITFKEFDASDSRGDLLFYTRGANSDSAPTERVRITSDGDLFVAGTGGMNTTQLPNGSTININGNSSNDGFSVIRYSSGYGAYGLNIGRSKSDTTGTNTLVTDGNDLGHITFYGADGSSYLKASQITAQVDGTPSAGSDMPGRLVFKTSSDGSATPTERLRIDSSGNVGVNDSDPSSLLSISQTNGNAKLQIKRANSASNTDDYGSILWRSSAGTAVGSINVARETGEDNGYMFFQTTSGGTMSEQMRIGSNGRVDIGNELGVAHAGVLQVIHTGGGQQDNDALSFFETNAQDWIIMTNFNASGTHYHMRFQAQGSVKGAIYGNSGADVQYAGSSDYRLKENIVEITGTQGIDICKKLKPSYFNWIENRIQTGETNTVDGFIAHEVQEAGLLGVVSGEKDAVNEDGSINGQMMDYGKMTPVLSAAIKGLIDKVETLETQNADLLARVTALEG